ncbi:FIMAH domain-containing protein [Georgenia subflava]|uniref:FIMAH domain-containing protein n=1 Tax=Georgenia subflava TaxID=1622177 RepID=A0A6N7EB53_9MICO|nr:hypothetical protein [Georgenia subflava]MPV35612.1 hypothetical protein [Georgenia subflava]
MRRLSAFAATLGLAAAVVATAVPSHAATGTVDEPPEIVDHGTVPLTATTVAGAAAGTMPDGTPRLWAVVSGSPAYLAEIDPLAGTVENTYPMPGASGGWGVDISSDGTVWATSYMDASLYYLEPGATEVRSDGRPTPETSFAWQVDTDADGVAFTGTFQGWADSPLPPGHLASYDRTTGEWRDYGSFGEGMNYVRSTAVVGDTAYAGTGTVAGLFAVDIDSGDVAEVPLPDGRTDCTFVYELAAADTDLYAKIECQGAYVGYVYDTVAEEWSEPIGALSSQSVGQTADGRTWFVLAGNLAYRTPAGEVVDTGHAFGAKGVGVTTDADGAEWVVGMSHRGLVHRYEVATGEAEPVPVGLDSTSVNPRAMAVGPDGRIHVGGYLSGGFATFDPAADSWTFERGLGQAEGMVAHDGLLYAGVYPGARLYEIDTSIPLGDGNPRQVLELRETTQQDRPFGMASAGDLVAVGTVGGYGVLKGSLTLYDPETGTWDEYHDLITDQSIITLEEHDGVLYGGTSVFGGNGIEPTQSAGVVFAFDLASRELLWSTPVDGLAATAVTMADGELWAATVGDLLVLDPATGEITHEHEVAPFDWGTVPNGLWRSADLEFSEADGYIYGSVFDRILRIDPDTREVDQLEGASGIKLDLAPDNTTYWIDDRSLFSATWPVDAEEPEQGAAQALVDLAAALDAHVANGDVAGPIAHQLANAVTQAQRHVEGDRTEAATRAVDRFVRHLDEPKRPDTLSEAARDDLRTQAVSIRELLG